MSAAYRIEFTIQRAESWDGEFVDVGFGSSGASDSVASAAYAVSAQVQNKIWETEAGMPDPDELEANDGGES